MEGGCSHLHISPSLEQGGNQDYWGSELGHSRTVTHGLCREGENGESREREG